MLYDKRWDAKVETKADPFSLESLIAWLEKQPSDRTYSQYSTTHCVLACYFSEHYGHPVTVGGVTMGPIDNRDDILIPEWMKAVAFHDRPFTYGAALARAKAITSTHRPLQG